MLCTSTFPGPIYAMPRLLAIIFPSLVSVRIGKSQSPMPLPFDQTPEHVPESVRAKLICRLDRTHLIKARRAFQDFIFAAVWRGFWRPGGIVTKQTAWQTRRGVCPCVASAAGSRSRLAHIAKRRDAYATQGIACMCLCVALAPRAITA